MSHRWSKEEEEWLKCYYPDHGGEETRVAFNKRFGLEIGLRSIFYKAGCLGLKLSKDRYKKKQYACGKNYGKNHRPSKEVGFINADNGMIKTENGWARLGAILGVPKGYYAVHLDGNILNNDPDNIRVISQHTSMKMTKDRLWSRDPVLTKSGLLCCDLEDILDEQN